MTISDGYPSYFSHAQKSPKGVYYFTEPSVIMIGKTKTDFNGLKPFFDSFDASLGFQSYLNDSHSLADGTYLSKFAGQLCYMSFGPKRTYNEQALKYFTNVMSQSHGCYDEETEVLTNHGWKKWQDVNYQDMLATRTSSGHFQFHFPTQLFCYDYKGRMYRIKSKQVDLLVTPNHNLLVAEETIGENIKGQFKLIKAEDLNHKTAIFTNSAEWFDFDKNPPPKLVSANMVGVLGYYNAFGGFLNKEELYPVVSKEKNDSFWVEDWRGKVYCAEVPNHTLYVRRNGIPIWCGNSILEHATYSFLIYGVDRAITKELTRHRSGKAISECSQRYVSGKILRFVERASFQNDPILHQAFIERIEKAHDDYNTIGDRLAYLQSKGDSQALFGDSARDLRKKVNESARACLPNETESPIVMTGNIRSWRHVIEMRASEHAEFEIRRVAVLIYRCLKQVEPLLFADYEEIPNKDGVPVITTKYRKV